MSLLDGMRKAWGRQLSASAAQRRRIAMQSNNPLPADRIAAALGTLPPGEWFPSPADPGPRRYEHPPGEALGEFSRVGSRQARSAQVARIPVVSAGGRHRQATSTEGAVSEGLLAAGAKSHRLMVLGVLVILVAVAVAFGVRAALAPPVAQPELVATTLQSQAGPGFGAVPTP